MEFIELTVEDMLNGHRSWITELYVQDRKTEAEIVELLRGRGLVITLTQIRRCILEWNLVQLPTEEPPASSPSPTLSDDWEFVSTPPNSETVPRTVPHASYTPSDPALISEYNKKPLPSIPTQKSSKIQKRRPSSTTDRLKLTCHHGPAASDVHEVQTPLKLIPDGTSPIERWTKDEQTHERIALGLKKDEQTQEMIDSDEDVDDIVRQLPPWRRAVKLATNAPRRHVEVSLPPRRPKKSSRDGNEEPPSSGESNGKRKRKP